MLKPLSILFFIFAGLLWGLQWMYDTCTLHNLNIKPMYVATHTINADFVMVGSSNTLYMVDAEQLANENHIPAYNLAANHASFRENYASFYLYLLHNKAPKYLIIGVSPVDLKIAGSVFHPYLFLPFIADTCVHRISDKEQPIPILLQHIPFGRYAYYNTYTHYQAWQGLWHWVSGKQRPYYANGTQPIPTHNRGFIEFEEFIKGQAHKIPYSWTTKNDADLTALISLALQHNTQPVVVNLPYWRGIDDNFEGKIAADRHIAILSAQNKALYWNYDTLSICSNKDYFTSVFHANAAGSMIFTRVLAQKLLQQKGL
jgi:hypothetical protein